MGKLGSRAAGIAKSEFLISKQEAIEVSPAGIEV